MVALFPAFATPPQTHFIEELNQLPVWRNSELLKEVALFTQQKECGFVQCPNSLRAVLQFF
jgi:hypothetical protein